MLLSAAHACTYIIMCPSAVISHTSPSGLNPWPNKRLTLCLSVRRHMFRCMRPSVSNWNKTVAEVIAQWFWWRVIDPATWKVFLSIHLNILSLDLTSFLWPELTIFHSEDLCVSFQGSRISACNNKNTESPVSGCFAVHCYGFRWYILYKINHKV